MGAADVTVFDVNETLSDMSPLASRFSDLGVPPQLAQVWFASLLRDGFALTSVGEARRFADLAREQLRTVLTAAGRNGDGGGLDSAVSDVMSGFAELGVHADVVPGVNALAASGARLVTLTNGAASVANGLLSAAGIRDRFDQLLSVEDAGIWKPAEAAYRYAASACGVDVTEMMMVAVHPWDIHGAARVGMRTVWVNRGQGRYPSYFSRPDHVVGGVDEIVGLLPG